MPPKPVTRNAKAAGEEAQAQANDPMALMQQMLDVMQKQIQKRDDEIQKRDEQLQKRDEQMLELMDKIANGTTSRANEHNDTDERNDAVRSNRTKSKKVDTPVLGPVDSVSMADYRTWRESFEGYSNVLKLQTECDLTGRRTMLRQALDPSWAKLWTTGMLNVKQADDVTDILNLIRAYLRKQRSPLLDRRDFHCRNQQPHEKVDQYYAELTMCYDSCDFGDNDLVCADCREPCGHGQRLREERLRDRLIFGLYSEKIRQKVLEEPFETLTLERTHQIVQAMESSQLTSEDLQKQNVSVDKVKSRNKSAYKQGKFEQNRGAMPKKDCYRCGRQRHKMEKDCPAYDAQCRNCHKTGHYEKCCRRPRQEGSKQEVNKKSLQTVRVAELHKMNDTRPRLQISTRIGKSKHDIMWLCDTGAEVSVIGLSQLNSFKGYKKRQSDVTLYGATDDELGELGRVIGTLQYGDIVLETDIYVVKILPMPILSHVGLKKLGILHERWPYVNALSLDKKECRREVEVGKIIENGELRGKLFKEFPNVFPDDNTVEPLRPMNGKPMEIELMPDAKPFKRYKANTLPYAWEGKVKAQLDTMVAKDVIETVEADDVGEWCLGMVAVPKRGSDEPRITIDFSPLNKYVKRRGYPTKIPKDEVAQIPAGMKFFTTLDGRHGYWQVLLNKASRYLTTFITPWGHYRFKRNVMGLVSAGDEHNLRGDEAIAGIGNVKKIVEDIVIYDKDYDEHIKRVTEVLKRCEKAGITLSRKKAVIAQPEVEWCGYKLTEHGYTISPRMGEALKRFPVPKSRTDVRSFSGLVQQFEGLSPNLTGLMKPIRELQSTKAVFQWTNDQQKAFDDVIKELSSTRILTSYRPGAKLRLETDAAQKTGFGFALWQEEPDDVWRLLRCGSRTVSDAESRYSVTESELKAVVSAVKKLRLYLEGAHFLLIVDHKPLIPILNSKCLDEITSPRIRNLKEKLMGFNFTTQWREGVKHVVADVFSRYPVSAPDEDELVGDEEIEGICVQQLNLNAVAISSLRRDTGITDLNVTRVKQEIDKDPTMGKLRQMVLNGFPGKKQDLCHELTPYWTERHEFSVVDDIILRGKRMVIPPSMRLHVLNGLHAAHQGINRTLQRARQCVYWPRLTNDIRQRIEGCPACAENQASQCKEPLLQDKLPTRPGEAIAADIFTVGKDYLVITDKYSGWVEIFGADQSMNTARIKNYFTSWFAALGVPTRLTTDGGPQFKSGEFASFCEQWGIIYDPSSPYHPISNGYAEAAVKSMKGIIKKVAPGKNVSTPSILEALLEYRNTPKDDGLSPAQRLFGRPMKTRLPAHPIAYKKTLQNEIRQADKKALLLKEKAKTRYNQNAKEMNKLTIGDIVRVQHHVTKRWDLIAEVIGIKERGRSYQVRSETGRLYWRNRRFLRPYNPVMSNHNEPNIQTSSPEKVDKLLPRRSKRLEEKRLKVKNRSRYSCT